MNPPSLLLLLAVAAPTVAGDLSHRCDLPRLKGVLPCAANADPYCGDAKTLLTTEAMPGGISGAQRSVINLTDARYLCHETVWRYLAVLPPGPVFYDPEKTHPPVSAATLRWNDPALGKAWDAGLEQQIRVLLAVDELFFRVVTLGRDALAKADEAVNAAIESGIVVKGAVGPHPVGEGIYKLRNGGLTTPELAQEEVYEVSAPAPSAVAAASPAGLKAFAKLLNDNSSKALTPGPAVLAFRRAIIMLANELAVRSMQGELMQRGGVTGVSADFSPSRDAAAAAKAALVDSAGNTTLPPGLETRDAAYEAALKFLVGPEKITAIDDESPHDAAALSRLDYGLRNLIALRAAAVDRAVAEAKRRLSGRDVAETLAASNRAQNIQGNPDSKAMAAEVLRHMEWFKTYQELDTLDKNPDPAWRNSSSGKAVRAQMGKWREDAAKTAIMEGAEGRRLWHSSRGKMVEMAGVDPEGLKKDSLFRNYVAREIASGLVLSLSPEARAVLDAFRGAGAPGTAVSPALTLEQRKTAETLPPPIAAPAAKAPLGAYDAVLAEVPAVVTRLRIAFFPIPLPADDHRLARYDSMEKAKIAKEASAQSAKREADQQAVNRELAAIQERADAARGKIQSASSDPDDTPAVALWKRSEAQDALDRRIQAEKAKVVRDGQARHVDSDATASLKAEREKLNAKVDAAYSDGIAQALEALKMEYKREGGPRRSYAEKQSGYEGPYYRLNRVDDYFNRNWGGDAQKSAIERCKAALGFKKDVDGGDFRDPSVDNVDRMCGVRDGLIASLAAHKGTNDARLEPSK